MGTGNAREAPRRDSSSDSDKSASRNHIYWGGTVAAIAIGVGLALAGSHRGATIGGIGVFAACALISFAINWTVFVPSFKAQTEHYYDLTGSITYFTVTVAALVLTSDWDLRSIIMAALVLIWAGRLGTFLFRRVKADGRDQRFDRIKVNFAWFLMSWTIQALWVLFTAAAALGAITSGSDASIGVVFVIGLVIWIIGFAIEVVSDTQKSAFRADPANKGRFINVGLWAWSRHPNYFGEIVLWVGMAIMALPTMEGWRYVTLISPVFVFLLLTRVSGVPMLEASGKKRWGHEPAYQEYKAKTPVLILKPPTSS